MYIQCHYYLVLNNLKINYSACRIFGRIFGFGKLHSASAKITIRCTPSYNRETKNAGEWGHLCPPGQERVNISRNVMSKYLIIPLVKGKNCRREKYYIFSGKPYPQHEELTCPVDAAVLRAGTIFWGGSYVHPLKLLRAGQKHTTVCIIVGISSHNVGALRTDLSKSGTHWGQN